MAAIPATLLALAASLTPGRAAAQAVEPTAAFAMSRPDTVRPGASLIPYDAPFAEEQLQYPRVKTARMNTRFGIKKLFRERGLSYPAAEIFLRVFKRERQLELWVRPMASDTFALLRTYPICALAGVFGPKTRQGDWQTPEGFYEIDHFNPWSQYHLSLHMNYPNRADRMRSTGAPLGGQIFIHGGCQTEGCIAVTDEAIEELYWISVEARAAGQPRIPVHIFPVRLTDEEMTRLGSFFEAQPELHRFWSNLKPGFDHFEATRTLPRIAVDGRGRYVIGGRTGMPGDARVLGEPIANPEPKAETRTERREPEPKREAPAPRGPQVVGTPLDPETLEPIAEKSEPEAEVAAETTSATRLPDNGPGRELPARIAAPPPRTPTPAQTLAPTPARQGPPRLAAAHAARLAAAAKPAPAPAGPDVKGQPGN